MGLDSDRPEHSRVLQTDRMTPGSRSVQKAQGPPARQPHCQLASKALGYSVGTSTRATLGYEVTDSDL